MIMKTVRTPETSVHLNVITRCYIPEDSKLHHPICHRDDMLSLDTHFPSYLHTPCKSVTRVAIRCSVG
jgi:hypothetical protein